MRLNVGAVPHLIGVCVRDMVLVGTTDHHDVGQRSADRQCLLLMFHLRLTSPLHQEAISVVDVTPQGEVRGDAAALVVVNVDPTPSRRVAPVVVGDPIPVGPVRALAPRHAEMTVARVEDDAAFIGVESLVVVLFVLQRDDGDAIGTVGDVRFPFIVRDQPIDAADHLSRRLSPDSVLVRPVGGRVGRFQILTLVRVDCRLCHAP